MTKDETIRRSTLQRLQARRSSVPACALCRGQDVRGGHRADFVRLFSAPKCAEAVNSGVGASDALSAAGMDAWLVCPREDAERRPATPNVFEYGKLPPGYEILR